MNNLYSDDGHRKSVSSDSMTPGQKRFRANSDQTSETIPRIQGSTYSGGYGMNTGQGGLDPTQSDNLFVFNYPSDPQNAAQQGTLVLYNPNPKQSSSSTTYVDQSRNSFDTFANYENGSLVSKHTTVSENKTTEDGSLVNNNESTRRKIPYASLINYAMSCKDWTVLIFFTFSFCFGLIFCSILFTSLLSSASADISSSMVVHTGQRTRDWSSGNSYSMRLFDEDQNIRLYVCMKTAGYKIKDRTDDKIESIGDYQAAAKKVYDCSLDSDRGWPRDVGFLRCLQRHFDSDFHRSNLFLKCMDLTEGQMFETHETQTSTLFLGSYNFVAFLVMALATMGAFLLFTAGGIFFDFQFDYTKFTIEYNRDVNGDKKSFVSKRPYVKSKGFAMWAPLAVVPTLLALAWSCVVFGTSMYFTFPTSGVWSDQVSVNNGASSFPRTTWTGYLCSGGSFLLAVFFAACLLQYFYDRKSWSDRIQENLILSNQNLSTPQSGSNIIVIDDSNKVEQMVQGKNTDSTKPVSINTKYNRNGNKYGHKLGVRYNHNLYYGDDNENITMLYMTPIINKVYAFAMLFVDGFLFLGMLNNQNSLLNENVVNIWFFTLMHRAYHLAGDYFIDDVMFNPSCRGLSSVTPDNNNYLTEFQIHHCCIAFVCAKLASFWCLILVSYHFASAMGVPKLIQDSGFNTPVYSIQATFLAFYLVVEFGRHVVGFLTVKGFLKPNTYKNCLMVFFTFDWIMRFIFITATVFAVPTYLGDINSSMFEYFKEA